MSIKFEIVPLPNGHFRVEKLVMHGDAVTYESASFSTRREAQLWIERQNQAPPALRIHYIVTPTNGGTYLVTLARTDREAHEVLGEFSTIEDANEFIRRMRELDAAPTHENDQQ